MKLMFKIAGVIILVIILVAIAAFGIYWHRNIHWYDKYEKALGKVNAREKQVTLPNGRTINYGEVENDRGQLIIPKAAREKFGLTGGQRLIVLSDEKEGIALIPADIFEAKMQAAMKFASLKPE